MAYIRKLPSGRWQATVRLANGKKVTNSDPLKSVVRQWAVKEEARIASGDLRDPRAGQVRVGQWYERVSAARQIDPSTAAKHTSLWRTHCGPAWASWPMSAVTRMEAQAWANRLAASRRARHKGRSVAPGEDVPLLAPATVAGAVHLMSGLYKAALGEYPPLVTVNPFAGLELPAPSPHGVAFYEHQEAQALYEAMEARPGRKWRVLTELGMQVGLRPGEIYGLHGHRVDWLRGLIEVIDVMTRSGLRQWPKSRKSHRVVPVPPAVLEGMSVLMAGRARDCLVFTAPAGGPVTDTFFRRLIWQPAVAAARLCGRPAARDGAAPPLACGPVLCGDPAHMIRAFAPRIMRHTAASWLVMDGVPLYDVQALLGHESFVTTQRYAHLAPGAHSRVIESWSRAPGAPGAPVAHGAAGGLHGTGRKGS